MLKSISKEQIDARVDEMRAYCHPRFTEDDLWRMAYCDELSDRYHAKFGACFGVPFGHWRSEQWNGEDTERELEIALETGVPFEKGTPRWQLYFGDFEYPEGCAV